LDFWYKLAIFISKSARMIFIPKLHVEGQDHLFEGPKIIVANHALASEVFIIPSLVKERLHFFIMEDLLKLPFFGKLLVLADQIPVYAGRGQEVLQIAIDRLKTGHTVVIFPEGRLNHGKELLRAQSGAIRLAFESGFPLLPLGIYSPASNTRAIGSRILGRPAFGVWQFGGSSFISIGDPWELASDVMGKERIRQIHQATDELRDKLDQLVKQAQNLANRYQLTG
jgi:1-acyl-sn-glycerol-3-phosphate acyltransferase